MKIVSVTTFRSKPLVNMTDDMARVVLDMTRNELRGLEKVFKRLVADGTIQIEKKTEE